MSGFGQILFDFNRVGVRYVFIGGIALIRYGVVRMTRDIESSSNLRGTTLSASVR